MWEWAEPVVGSAQPGNSRGQSGDTRREARRSVTVAIILESFLIRI